MSEPVDELLRAVFLAPADDNARLVLADYLMERGDPRGELIRIQCALAMASGSYHAELAARERELLALRAPPPGTTVSYARGMCDAATVDANTADTAIPYLAGELVIDHLTLVGCAGSRLRWEAIGRLLVAVSHAVRTLRFENVIWYWYDSDTGDPEEIDERPQLVAALEGAPRPRYFVEVHVPEGTDIPVHWQPSYSSV